MRYVAFLRAINVTNRFVKMADLRQSLADLDRLANIETYIQTGNVLFDASAVERSSLERAIEARLQTQLGFPVPTFLRSAAEMREIAALWPFDEEPASDRLSSGAASGQAEAGETIGYVAFLRGTPRPELWAKLEAMSDGVDVLRISGSHVFWLHRRGPGKSYIAYTTIEKVLQSESTVRNITTVRKLAAMLSAGE